jgi:pimeloyl-ACP methyl ester carboxylesterase
MMVHWILSALFVSALVIAAIAAAGYCWRAFYAFGTRQDETSWVTTADGWRLAVHRYLGGENCGRLPVVLCHGLGANRYVFDLHGEPSLAPFLRRQGWDVWVAELRGSGMSSRPGLIWSDVPYGWRFEDLLNADMPAIIRHVLEKTGAAAIHWVGHSMGGMLIQAYLGRHAHPPIASVVTIASPLDFSAFEHAFFKRLLKAKWIALLHPYAPIPVINRLLSPFTYRLQNRLAGLFHVPNIRVDTARKYIMAGTEVMGSRELWLDFKRWLESGQFSGRDGKPYVSETPRVPVLALGGSADRMAPEVAVKPPYGSLDNPNRHQCLILGKAAGCAEDYGHIDLLVGNRSEAEVFPHISGWMEAHESGPRKTDG